MRDPNSDTADKILSAAFKLFFRKGFARVSVDDIATQAGVTKRTVYYHFSSKDEIAGEVMSIRNGQMLSHFETWTKGAPPTPEGIVQSLFANLILWAQSDGWLGSGYSRIAAELADLRGHPARVAAASHKTAVEGWLASRLGEVGVTNAKQLAAQVMVLIEGGIGLTVIHNDPVYLRHAHKGAIVLVAC